MQDLSTRLRLLKRPGLLVAAATEKRTRISEKAILKRTNTRDATRRVGAALADLLGEEADLNHQRTTGQASYSPARHIDIVAALQILAGRYAVR